MARTLQEIYNLALLKRGERDIKYLTGCIVMSRAEGGYYYLGKAGSVRYGNTRSTSIPISVKLKAELGNDEL